MPGLQDKEQNVTDRLAENCPAAVVVLGVPVYFSSGVGALIRCIHHCHVDVPSLYLSSNTKGEFLKGSTHLAKYC